MVNWDNFISIQNITTSMRATQPLTHALGARPAVQPQSCREMRVKLRNHQNINTTNPTRKETRFPFHYHVTFRVCPTAKSSHRAKIVSRGVPTFEGSVLFSVHVLNLGQLIPYSFTICRVSSPEIWSLNLRAFHYCMGFFFLRSYLEPAWNCRSSGLVRTYK